MKKTIRIGSGAGYGGDRIEPAIDLMKRGNLDYIIFECLAERTISLAQKARRADPDKGYNDRLEYRFDQILDVLKDHPVKVITNMGAANPEAAARKVADMAQEKGISGLKIAWVTGDDKTESLEDYLDYTTIETGGTLREIDGEILSANGYIGIRGIVEALEKGADIVITGRASDPSLSLAPLVYEFGWEMDDYEKLGRGTWVGHLLECAGQVSGGYFADPGIKDVPDLWNLGFPYIDVDEDGNGVVSKLEGTGGLVSEETVKEQTLYEIQDPANYYTPDVIADFSHVHIEQAGENKVAISNATGKAPNGFYKTSVGYFDSYIADGQISYGGSNALARANLAKEVLEKRLEIIDLHPEEVRYDFIGLNSIDQNPNPDAAGAREVRLRMAARTKTREEAQKVVEEVETLYTNGPFGGGGVSRNIDEIISIASILIPADHFNIQSSIVEVQ